MACLFLYQLRNCLNSADCFSNGWHLGQDGSWVVTAFKVCWLSWSIWNSSKFLYATLLLSQFLFPAGAPTLLRLFLLFKDVKSLYFAYSIVNFTTLNLQGITSLHLLTTRVGLLLKSVRLFLQTTGVA